MKSRGAEPQMRNEFTAIFERDGEWYIAYCPEIPGANGQGHTKVEARRSLAEAISLILEDRRRDHNPSNSRSTTGPTGRETPARGF